MQKEAGREYWKKRNGSLTGLPRRQKCRVIDPRLWPTGDTDSRQKRNPGEIRNRSAVGLNRDEMAAGDHTRFLEGLKSRRSGCRGRLGRIEASCCIRRSAKTADHKAGVRRATCTKVISYLFRRSFFGHNYGWWRWVIDARTRVARKMKPRGGRGGGERKEASSLNYLVKAAESVERAPKKKFQERKAAGAWEKPDGLWLELNPKRSVNCKDTSGGGVQR